MLSPKNETTGSPKQPRQPIESWTTKTIKSGDRSRQNGLISSPRGLYGRSKVPVSGKRGVGGEWALKECEEHTAWLNGILKKHKSRPINDLRKSISDGLTLVNILEILFNGKIRGVQTRPIIRAQRLENINLCLRFLENRGVEIQHISADELTDGNLRATLSLVTCLRKRFEAFHTSNSAHGEGSNTSFDKSNRLPTEDSIRPPLGREASVHSYNSQHSIHSQHSDGPYSRPKSSEIPATIQSDEELHVPVAVSPPVNGDADLILPGTLADSDPDEPRPESTDKNENLLIPSMTELDSQGVSQHGVSSRKHQMHGTRIPFTKSHSIDGHSSIVSSNSHVRDAVSQSVEEKLRHLLDTPSQGSRPANNQPIDDGELLEPPPPRLPRYPDDDGEDDEYGTNEEIIIEENKLQAMLEDPDNFDDYSKDWDRYISGYVPSHSTEKTEGPRAQRLLDRQPAQPSPASSSQQRPLPFFHAPPSQHMGPVTNTAPMVNQAPYPNGSQSLAGTDSWGYSGMYDRGGRNHQYNGPSLDSRMQQYYPGDESPPQRRRLPSYTDHIQRYPPKRRMSNGRSPGAMYGPEGSRMQNNPMWQPPGFPRDWQEARRPGYEQRSDYPPMRDYDQQIIDQDHQRVRQYLNHKQSGASPNHQGIPMEDLSRRSDYRYIPSRKKSDTNSYVYVDHPTANSRMQQGYLRNSRDHGAPRNFSPSDDSSRSSTPPLPPLSPDNSDADSLPASPYLGKKSQRSISVGVLPPSIQLSSNKLLNDSSMGMKKRKGNSSRGSSSALRTFEPRSSSRRSMGKGRRKVMTKGGKSNSSNIPASATVSNKRKSSNSRALPSVPLRKLQEHTEHTDSDLSSHHSDRHSDSDDSESISHIASLPSKASLKIPDTVNQQQQQSATESMEPPDADNIRQQLVALEKMYKEVLSVIGNEQREQTLEKPGDRLSVSSLNTAAAKTLAKTKVPSSAKPNKRREKDIKLVNKRFARVESHVVTLARSVAHLSSEMRSQSVLFHEIEGLRHEIDQIRDIQAMNSNISPNGGMKFRPIVPLSSSPRRIKKLTKFFGEEPPLLTMFLQELGYTKYVPLFEKEDIGMVELPYLSEERLESIGIPTGPRLRILQEAQLMV